MLENEYNLIHQIVDRTSFLFLGQSYLKINGDKDLILQSTLDKYLLDLESGDYSYSDLFKIDFKTEKDEKLTWINRLSQKLSPPKYFDEITRLPWSAVYTSAIDDIIIKAFETDWRSVQPIFNEKQVFENPRSRYELKVNYLFGSINQPEGPNCIPLNIIQKIDRCNHAITWLKKLPELLTTQGQLIIEGYNPNADWLGIEQFYTIVNSLGRKQTYFFSFNESYLENPFISDLVKNEKLVTFSESLISYLNRNSTTEFTPDKLFNDSSVYGKWIRINNRRVRIPNEIKTRLLKSGIIIDDSMTTPIPENSEIDKYTQFKRFLSSGSNQLYWTGFGSGFAFERTFVVNVAEKITALFNSNMQKSNPLIIYGQSSSGKTIGLGHLAYFISTTLKQPVFFISRTYVNPNDIDIDLFCEWTEENGAKFTFILWDGMSDTELYQNLLSKLNARGRKVIIIGTQYKLGGFNNDQSTQDNFIEAKIQLDKNEQAKLSKYLSVHLDSSDYVTQLIKKGAEENFLSVLYRYLPDSKRNIERGLQNEIDLFSQHIIKRATAINKAKPKTRLSELLINAGLASEQTDTKFEVGGDYYDLREQFINYIMIPGSYGISIPFELLLRCLGTEIFYSSIFDELKKTDIIKWFEDKNGNIYLEPRTTIEAEILSRMLGSRKARIDIIKNLISHLNIGSNSDQISIYEDSSEINFAVDLLKSIGPNSVQKIPYEDLLEIAETLEKVRINLNAYHPRLILQEVSFYREISKNLPELSDELLNKSEELLKDEIQIIEESSRPYLETYFKVELASTIGTSISHLLTSDNPDKGIIIDKYNFVKNQISASIIKSTENYYAIDVFLWTTRNLIDSDILTSQELISVEAELYNIIDVVEFEGVNEVHREQFNERKYEIGISLDNKELTDQAADILEQNGSSVTFYIRTRRTVYSILESSKQTSLADEDYDKLQTAFNFLSENKSKIFNDPKCTFLEFRIWWLLNARQPLFFEERSQIAFSDEQWFQCLDYISRLKTLDNIYESPSLLYPEAIAYFHLRNYRKSKDIFRLIDSKSDFSNLYGSRRVKKFHLLTDSSGKAKRFSGEASETILRQDHRNKGNIFVNEIREKIPYTLNDFKVKEVQRGQRFTNFVIAFNFRGPILIPANRLGK